MAVAHHPAGEAVPGETVAEAVRRQILDAVLFGDLAAPSRLFPADLATRFGVSITPIREALARLGAEGFIDAIPRHGYHVRSPTPEAIAELWTVRLSLELMGCECILNRFPHRAARHRALASLHAIHRELGGHAAQSHRDHVRLNGRFHDTIVELAGNALLLATYQGIRVRLVVGWVQRGTRAWRARLAGEQAEHDAILQGLAAGDPAATAAALRAHLSRSLTDALADLDRSAQKSKTEETDESTRQHGPRGRPRAAVQHRDRHGSKRAPGHDPDVDLPQPRRHQPARSRAG